MLQLVHTPLLPRVTLLRAIRALVALSTTVSTVVSCGLIGTDHCPAGTARCNGNVPEQCEQDCYEPGCGLQWQSNGDCGAQQCVSVGDGVAFCAASSTPDPKCSESVGGYCDGSVAVSCRAGYAEFRSDCAAVERADSGSTPGTPTCVIETVDFATGAMCSTVEKWCGPRAATCSAPTECGPVTSLFAQSQAVPVPGSGVIQDGVYFLTEAYKYGGSPADPSVPIQATRRIQNGVMTSSVFGDTDAGQSSGAFTVEGTNLVWTVDCPAPSTKTFGFTATQSTLTLYETQGSVVYEFVHRRQ
jgi:hypothetical protein